MGSEMCIRDSLESVPKAFVDILRVALSKMCELPGINPNIVNNGFWKRMPGKFRNVVNYERIKQRKHVIY